MDISTLVIGQTYTFTFMGMDSLTGDLVVANLTGQFSAVDTTETKILVDWNDAADHMVLNICDIMGVKECVS